MRILIEYDSCWHMSFLGDDDKKPIEKVNSKANTPSDTGYMQKFVATSKAQGQKESHTSVSTVLGVLSRLIGDQRKLYQARSSNNFYFSDIESCISFKEINTESTNELVYLTNKSDDRCSQGNFLGVISDDNPWFSSKIAPQFWSVLYLNKKDLLKFILSKQPNFIINDEGGYSKPINLLSRVDEITDITGDTGSPWFSAERVMLQRESLVKKFEVESGKASDYRNKFMAIPPKTDKQRLSYKNKIDQFEKNLTEIGKQLKSLGTSEECLIYEEELNKAIALIVDAYPDIDYWKDGVLYPYRLYAVALYLQAQRLIDEGYDLSFMINSKSELQIQGFSKRGFNGVRDWLNAMTGGRKKAVGTPCNIKKQSGFLEIELRLDSQEKGLYFKDMSRSEEIKTLIENAGVSSFYLGKKGLAYVSNIRL